MNYTIAAHPTKYKDTLFRSWLEARWAAFFDLAGWKWDYEPIDLVDWLPDFIVSFPCGHSECPKRHALAVEIKPFFSTDDFFRDTRYEKIASKYLYGGNGLPASAIAFFGVNPSVTTWEMAHGAGGGVDNVPRWVDDWERLWAEAGNITRYKAPKEIKRKYRPGFDDPIVFRGVIRPRLEPF